MNAKVKGLIFGLTLAAVFVISAYGNDSVTGGNFTDTRDGTTYRAVTIGDLTWMAENLNYQTENSWCYDNDNSNCETYGRLYTWNAAMAACPSGWRLPGDGDWDNLMIAISDSSFEDHRLYWADAGIKLKSRIGWNVGVGHISGTDDYYFSALPGGLRRNNGGFNSIGSDGYWWSATELDNGSAWLRGMRYRNSYVNRGSVGKNHLALSVRCVRD